MGGGVLPAPHGIGSRGAPAISHLTPVNAVAGAPLTGEVNFARMTDDAFVARAGRLDPIGQVSAITGTGRASPGSIDEGIALDGLVNRLIYFIARRFQRVKLDRLCELLAEAGGAAIVRHQDDVA